MAYVGRDVLRDASLDVFNSTSVSSFIATRLLDLWGGKKKLDINSMWEAPYQFLYNKLAARRTGFTTRRFFIDPFGGKRMSKEQLGDLWMTRYIHYPTACLDSIHRQLSRKPINIRDLREQPWITNPSLLERCTPAQLEMLSSFPLKPYDNMPPAKPAYYAAGRRKLASLSGKGLH